MLAAAGVGRGAAKSWMVGANTAIQGYGLYQAIDLVRSLEFPVIEVHPMGRPEPTPKVFPGFQFDAMTAAERAKLKGALRGFRRVTTHLPYTGLNWLSADKDARAAAVKAVDVALEGSGYLGAKLSVLHPQPLTNASWKTRETEYVDAIRRWGDRARQLGIQIAVETGFPPSVAEHLDFIHAINHPSVGATLDVGHQGRFKDLASRVEPEDRAKPESIKLYNDTNIELVQKLGPKLFHLHVHDIDPETWVEHKPMMYGFVDYPRLFAKLREVEYAGVLMLEIGGDPAKMPEYLRVARDKFRGWLG